MSIIDSNTLFGIISTVSPQIYDDKINNIEIIELYIQSMSIDELKELINKINNVKVLKK